MNKEKNNFSFFKLIYKHNIHKKNITNFFNTPFYAPSSVFFDNFTHNILPIYTIHNYFQSPLSTFHICLTSIFQIISFQLFWLNLPVPNFWHLLKFPSLNYRKLILYLDFQIFFIQVHPITIINTLHLPLAKYCKEILMEGIRILCLIFWP